MQGCNNELVKMIEELKEKRSIICGELGKQEEEKLKLEQQMEELKNRLGNLNRIAN